MIFGDFLQSTWFYDCPTCKIKNSYKNIMTNTDEHETCIVEVIKYI